MSFGRGTIMKSLMYGIFLKSCLSHSWHKRSPIFVSQGAETAIPKAFRIPVPAWVSCSGDRYAYAYAYAYAHTHTHGYDYDYDFGRSYYLLLVPEAGFANYTAVGQGLIIGMGSCVVGIMVAAVVKGHNQQGELTQGEAMSCGLAYWFGGMQNPGRSHYAQAGQTKFAARGTRHLVRSDKAGNTNLYAGLTTEVAARAPRM